MRCCIRGRGRPRAICLLWENAQGKNFLESLWLCELPQRPARRRATVVLTRSDGAAGLHKGTTIMTIRTDNPSTIGKPSAGQRHPTLLIAAELDQIAAAGSKKGLTGGAESAPPPRPK
jgi:hypothetical protein